MRKKTVFGCILVLLLTAGLFGCAEEKTDGKTTVMLAEAEGMTIIGKNSLSVGRGEKAVFSVEIPDGYTITCLTPDTVYNKQMGTITLENTVYPTTIKVQVQKQELVRVTVHPEGGGTVQSDRDGKLEAGTVMHLSAQADDGYAFIGFSEGASLKNGGTYLTDTPEYAYVAEKHTSLYANFASENDTVLFYDLNGGHLRDSDSESYCQIVTQTFHLCPNTLPDTGLFERDGYVLAGYNSQADGSGTFYGCGWNVDMKEQPMVSLYAVWLPETPEDQFTFRKSGSNAVITGYTGDSCDILVIPEYLDGTAVTGIAAGAFTDVECREIFLSRNIIAVADGAFRNCTFSVCRFSDSIIDISDRAFESCTEFSTLMIQAVRKPTYQTTQHGSYAVKYERLMTTSSPKMVITAGSSSAYGFLSAQFIEKLAENGYGNWDVVNYACHYQTPGTFYIDVISHFMNEGDVLLHSPEPLAAQLGSRKLTAVMWQFFEGAYEAFSLVDIREYETVFSSFAEYNQTRQYMPDTSYEDHWDGVNEYGDCDFFKYGQYDGFVGGQGMFNFNSDLIKTDALNTVYDRITAQGAYVWLTFAPVNEGAVLPPSRNRKMQESYMDFIREKLHVTVISDVADQIWNGKYMFDTNLHLSTEGAKLRTDMLADDFMRQLDETEVKS